MKVNTTDGKSFTLTGENENDRAFLDALDIAGTPPVVVMMFRTKDAASRAYINTGAQLLIDRTQPQSVRSDAASQALGALGKLFSLGLREAAQDGHVGPSAANPQPQIQATASLVELNSVLHALRDVIVQQELVLQKMVRAHDSPSSGGEKAILRDGS
mgnify:CR=1 FL=1